MRASMKPSPSTPPQRKPGLGAQIVWRFKGDKGWRKGIVRNLMAKNRIVVIGETNYATFGNDTVAFDDIDWYPQ
ncbi:MAG: hypothetical protein U0990_12560 [Candidatus Nanopelagicales bacterium]|nr:hypothetical protein [Candidatus Nanopelagicales bacterium]